MYADDLNRISDILDLIIFADDTNFFYSHKDVTTLFHIVNSELVEINHWFKANKLSLNVNKTKCTLLYKISNKDDIPSKIPELVINNKLIE